MDWRSVVGLTLLFHGLVYYWRREWILRLETRRLNSSLNSVGTHPSRKFLRMWFRVGTYSTIIIGFPFTLFLFLRTIYYCIFPSIALVAATVVTTTTSTPPAHAPPLELHHEQLGPYPDADLGGEPPAGGVVGGYLAIQPVLPGWNLPISHLPYYILAILISVVIHELGHALASSAHKIPIQSVGVSVFGPLIPAAHVELNSSQLRETGIKKQLDILTAGVWMNLYLALITYFILPRMLPALLFPTHGTGSGLGVSGVWRNSGIGGPGGLDPGDVIVGIENCPVKDLDSWYTCLEKIWQSDPVGYCVGDELLLKFSNNSEGCCTRDDSPTHLCFIEMNIPAVPLPSNDSEPGVVPHQPIGETRGNHCLPAQPVVSSSPPELLYEAGASTDIFYGWDGRCHGPEYKCLGGEEGEGEVAAGGLCLLPRLVSQLHPFRIVRIQRRQGSGPKPPVLFVGNVMDLYNGIKSTEFIPRSWFLSNLLGFSAFAKLPEKLETVLLLTAGLSAGLAVVNMLPIYGLDGYHIVDAVARSCLKDKSSISRLVRFISWGALGVAILTVFCSLANAD